MANYSFTDRKTGQLVPPAKIDDMLRTALGGKPDAKKFCPAFDDMITYGILMAYKTGEVTGEEFDARVENLKNSGKWDAVMEEQIKLYRKFLVEDYRFSAWR